MMGYDLYQAVFVRSLMHIINVWHALAKQQKPTWTKMRHDEYLLNICCSFLLCFVVFFLNIPQSSVLEYVHGHKRLIFVAPNIRNGFPCSYKCFLHTSDVPCLLDWFHPLTLESLCPSLPLLSELRYHIFLPSFGPMVMLFFFGPARLSVLPSTFRQHNIASLPLPRSSYCLYPHSWADTSFSKDILHFCWGVF